MYSVAFSETAVSNIDAYIYFYKRYFSELYRDTGIFSEALILEKYNSEAKMRHREIFDIISKRLCTDKVLGGTPNNTLLISWRSKTLFIAWNDEDNVRIVTELIIK